MIWDLFRIFLSISALVLPLSTIIWRYKLLKSDDVSNLSNVRNNLNCFNCNEKMYNNLEEYRDLLFNIKPMYLFSLKHNKLSTCKSCNREIKINQINKNWIEYFKIKFKYFTLSDLSDKTIYTLLVTTILLFISVFTGTYKVAIVINNISILMYWGFQMAQNIYMRK